MIKDVDTELKIEGYASLFWTRDLNDDVTAAGAFAASLSAEAPVKMLHQHDEAEPVGVWDEVVEDAKGPIRPRAGFCARRREEDWSPRWSRPAPWTGCRSAFGR
jgi:hypothetical protein